MLTKTILRVLFSVIGQCSLVPTSLWQQGKCGTRITLSQAVWFYQRFNRKYIFIIISLQTKNNHLVTQSLSEMFYFFFVLPQKIACIWRTVPKLLHFWRKLKYRHLSIAMMCRFLWPRKAGQISFVNECVYSSVREKVFYTAIQYNNSRKTMTPHEAESQYR